MATQGPRKRRKDAGQAQGEGPKQDHVFRDFGGINTQAARQAIKETEFAWIENIMPLGQGNCIILPSRSAALAAVASGSCYFMGDYNLGGVNYMFMATDDGHAYQVMLDAPYTRTEIGAAFGTFGLQIAQWENSQLLIADPSTGYWFWDNTTLFAPGGVAAITITAGGDYTAIPTISFTGGGGSGAAAYAAMILSGTQTVTAGGTGYVVGDIITAVGGTFTHVATWHVDAVGGAGDITDVSIHDGGIYTALPAAPVATSGGTGTGATITPHWAVEGAVITSGGTDYVVAPTVVFSTGAATATAYLLGTGLPDNPEHIATFSNRVWISSGRTLYYSAPGSFYDFTSAGSGNTIITDETLHSDIQQLLAANGFLYFTGSHSVNVIGNVQVNSNGDTVFSNTNLSASVGSNQAGSVISYFRSVWMANKSGIYSAYGSTPSKTSDPLDGIFKKIDFSQPIAAGIMFLENILCAVYMVTYDDPLLGFSRPLLLIFFNRKWFVAKQGNDLVTIATGELGDASNMYGTDGTSLYQLFSDDTMCPGWSFSTAFWDMGDVVRDKQITKFGFEVTLQAGTDGTVDVLLEGLASTPPYSSNEQYSVPVTSAIEWLNNADEVVLWTNDSAQTVDWLGSGYFMNMQDGSEFGHYLGMTFSSQDVLGAVNSNMLEYTFRESW